MKKKLYNISFVGQDEKVFMILNDSQAFNLTSVNLILCFLSKKTLNPVDYFFKAIYWLRYKNTCRFLENILLTIYKKIYFLSSGFYKKYSVYLQALSKSKIEIIDLQNISEAAEYIRQYIDLVVISNWWLLPDEIIRAPQFKTVNIHPSALPKYRGSVPTLWALKNHDKETAVTFMLLDSRMDGGEIITQHAISIEENETAITLENKCDQIIKENLIVDLLSYLEGATIPFLQEEAKASKTAKYYDYMQINLFEEDGKEIINKVDLYPHLWPLDLCYLLHKGRIIKIKKVHRCLMNSMIVKRLVKPGDYLVHKKILYMKTKDELVLSYLFKDVNFLDSLYLYKNSQGVFDVNDSRIICKR